jgi:hypothetical protein
MSANVVGPRPEYLEVDEEQLRPQNEAAVQRDREALARVDARIHASLLDAVRKVRLDEIPYGDLTAVGMGEVATADGRVWFLDQLNSPGDLDSTLQVHRGCRSFTIGADCYGDPAVQLLIPTDATVATRTAADQAAADQAAAADRQRRAALQAGQYEPVIVSDVLGLSGERLPRFTLRDAVAQLRRHEAHIETAGAKVVVHLPLMLDGFDRAACVVAAATLSAAGEIVAKHRGDLANLPDRYVTPAGALV